MSAIFRNPIARGPWATLAALVLARICFGYQLQTVATLGPQLVSAFHIEFAGLGALIGSYMLAGVLVAIPWGFLARRMGDRTTVTLGLLLMTLGSLIAAGAGTPFWLASGRVVAGAGAVALTVIQGKIVADRFTGRQLTLTMGTLTGAFPLGIGLAQITEGPLVASFGWPTAFLAGAALSAMAALYFSLTYSPAPRPAGRTLAWPSRRECALVIVAGLIWTSYNAAYFNFLSYMPSWLAAHQQPRWVPNTVLAFATWGNLPAILLGGAMAIRFGRAKVFVAGTLIAACAVAGTTLADWPLLWAALFGTLGAMHGGLIIELGTVSARPENRAVGMGLFYTTYYMGGAAIPTLCGLAADAAGSAAGAFLCAAALSLLALPFYALHRHLAAQPV